MIKTYIAQNPVTGATFTRKTEATYTHAVIKSGSVSFHQSLQAAQRKARSGGFLVPAHLQDVHEPKPRKAANDKDTPKVALKFFAGKLHPGEEPRIFRVVQHWDSVGDLAWVSRSKPEIPTVGLMKEFLRAGLTKVALSDGVVTADFSTEELTK